MREKALAVVRSQSGKSTCRETQTNVLFFPFIIEYLDFWGFSVGDNKSCGMQHTLCNPTVSCQVIATHRDPYWIVQERGRQTTYCLWPRSTDCVPLKINNNTKVDE
jgi:hypothetical protein